MSELTLWQGDCFLFQKKNTFFAIFTYAKGVKVMNLSHYLWKKVNIRCKDGRFFSEHYVVAYDDRYDNVEPDEDGIGIVKNKDDNYGVEIYESEIESIEIVD